jgi:formate dehydrogenase major subunit
MGQKDKQAGRMELSRRDFLKVSAAGAAAVTALDWAPAPAMAQVTFHGGDTSIDTFHTTCPYCSASCGQVVAVGNVTKDVYDIYGDVDSPINNGGLCAKGAGAYQLVNNRRRLGAFTGTHPVNDTFAYDASATYTDGIAYKRLGNLPWKKMTLAAAFDEIAGGDASGDASHNGLVSYRGPVVPGNTVLSNPKSVQFFGSSHMNNEPNYTYRKLVAQFGTSMVEHQARI